MNRTQIIVPALLLVLPAFSFGQDAESAQPPQTVISSDRLEMETVGEKAFFLFSDNVKLTGNNLIVTCDRLEVHSDRTGDLDANFGKLSSIRQIVALGNVSISQEGRTARAGRVTVIPVEDKIVLTENPIVTDAQGSVSGERMIFYRGDRRAVVESGSGGPARVVLPAIPDLGFDNEVEDPTTTPEHGPQSAPAAEPSELSEPEDEADPS
jgi:lipopolysaccharide transport protein LptA